MRKIDFDAVERGSPYNTRCRSRMWRIHRKNSDDPRHSAVFSVSGAGIARVDPRARSGRRRREARRIEQIDEDEDVLIRTLRLLARRRRAVQQTARSASPYAARNWATSPRESFAPGHHDPLEPPPRTAPPPKPPIRPATTKPAAATEPPPSSRRDVLPPRKKSETPRAPTSSFAQQRHVMIEWRDDNRGIRLAPRRPTEHR